MQRTWSFVLISCLGLPPAAWSQSMSFQWESPFVKSGQASNPYATDVRIDGGRVVTETHGSQGRVWAYADFQEADLDDFDPALTWLETGPDTAIVHLFCRGNADCVAYYRVPDPASSGKAHTNSLHIWCDPGVCKTLFDLLDHGEAAGPSAARTPSAAPEPQEEEVIDGSDIPDVISFAPEPATARAPPAAVQPPAGEPSARRAVPSEEEARTPSEASMSSSNGSRPSEVARELDAAQAAQVARYSDLFELTPNAREAIEGIIEDYAARIFDEWRDNRADPESEPVNWIQFLVREAITDYAQDQFTNAVSRLAFGRDLSDMPSAFQKELAMLETTFTRLYNPFSLSAGFEQVNALGDIFDLWDE